MKLGGPLRTLLLAMASLIPAASWAWKPTPPLIIQCPGSEEVRWLPQPPPPTLHFGPFWSDGYRGTAKTNPIVTRCDDGGPFFWVWSAKVVAELPFFEPRPAAMVPVRHLTAAEYLQAIAQGLGDTPTNLDWLRRGAWWASNHARRAQGRGALVITVSDFPAGSPERANLEALVDMLEDGHGVDLFIKVDALRQLERFEEAQALLDSRMPLEPRFDAWANALADRIRLRDAVLVMLPPLPPPPQPPLLWPLSQR